MRKRITLKNESSSFTATLDARVLEPEPVAHIECIDLDSERNYALPYLCKYIAWLIVFTVFISSSVVLILYGMYYGVPEGYRWFATFIGTFLIGVWILEPIRIVLWIVVKSFIFKKKLVITARKVNPSLTSNPADPVKKRQTLNLRQYNSKCYKPMSLHKLRSRLDDIKFNLELKGIVLDWILYLAFAAIGWHLISIYGNPLAFYSNNALEETFLNASYTHTITFNRVNTYESLFQYLNETLLPSLLLNPVDNSSADGNETDRRRRSPDFTGGQDMSPPGSVMKKQILYNFSKIDAADDKNATNIFAKGWTINPNVKLIGRPRLRQVRVKSGPCKELGNFKTRNVECVPEMSLFNLETRDFSLRWDLRPPKGLSERQAAPWKYRSASESQSLPVFTKISAYPGGGYILNLARSLDNARTVLEFMDTFQWLDMRTRALFVEFTLYSADANLFNVVTIIAERSTTGYFIPSYRFQTCTLLFGAFEIWIFLWTNGLSVLLIFFLCREVVRIYRTSLKMYMWRAFSPVDIVLIIFAILSVICMELRCFYVYALLTEMESADDDDFVNVSYAAFWQYYATWTTGVFVCFTFFKMLRLTSYKVRLYQVHSTLTECYKSFVDLVFRKFILIIAFAFLFNLSFLDQYEAFSHFGLSVLVLWGRTFIRQGSIDIDVFSASPFLGPVYLFLFIVTISLLFVNVFIVVMSLYLQKVQEVPLMDRYQILPYVKYFLSSWRHKDLMRMKEGKIIGEKYKPDVLRLRGGGSKASKKHKDEEICVEPTKELPKVYLKDFVTKKRYDTTKYMDITADRLMALKYLMVYHLSVDERVRSILRDLSLRSLFYCLTNETTASDTPIYFFVENECGKKVFEKETFSQMRKVVEDFGKKRGFIVMDECPEEIVLGDKLDILEKKLCRLLKKSQQKEKAS